jgi:cytochrome P450
VTSLQRKFGDITFVKFLGIHVYDLHSPVLVREALIDNAKAIVRWKQITDVLRPIVGDSVFLTDGDKWQRQRRMLMPAFTPARVAGYVEQMKESAESLFNRIAPNAGESIEIETTSLFTHVSMDIILRTLFSYIATEKETLAINHAIRTLDENAVLEFFSPFVFPDWLPLPGKSSKRRALQTLRSVIGKQIEMRRTNTNAPPPDDVLQHLLNYRDENSGNALTEQEIFDQCMVTFVAGHEATATTLVWWSWLVSSDKSVSDHLVQELNSVLGGKSPCVEDLPSLVWLNASIKEAMRLYPTASVLMTRKTTAPMQAGGWDIPVGSLIRISPWVIQRDPRWYPAPEEFRPERFLPGAPEIPRGAFLAFGIGPHVCVGQRFSTVEMTIIAAMLLQRFELQRPPDASPCKTKFGVIMRPRDKLKLMFKPLRQTASI